MVKIKGIPVVSIVGRPNVGKSSLFNRMIKERKAVVLEQSGTTRDRVESVLRLSGRPVKLVDTGGYMTGDEDLIDVEVKEQIFRAMEEASLILFVVDAASGISPFDKEVAEILRKNGKPVIIVANKADNDKLKSNAVEFFEFGFDQPVAVSCLHGRGVSGLKDRLRRELVKSDELNATEVKSGLKIAVVGRPNVGKSSYINNILNMNRVIVSDIPGTTRDSVDTYFSYDGDEFILIDTAGMRHKRKVKMAVDVFSMMRSKDSIIRADLVILLLDAEDGITRDDLGILEIIYAEGKACLIVVNKWDLSKGVDDVDEDSYRRHLIYSSNGLNKYPISFVSSLTGKNVISSLMMVKTIEANLDMKVSTPYLNKIFEKDDPSDVPVPRRHRRPNFMYITQKGTRPLEFVYFVDHAESVSGRHMSFIENKLRDNLPLTGLPVRIVIKSSPRGGK